MYTFEKLENKESFIPYVRLDFREKSMKKTNYEDYVTLFSDSGWKLIKGSHYGGIQYFQQKSPDVTRGIFSDKDSQESMKRRYVKFGYSYGFLFLFYFYIFYGSKTVSMSNLLNVKVMVLNSKFMGYEGNVVLEGFPIRNTVCFTPYNSNILIFILRYLLPNPFADK